MTIRRPFGPLDPTRSLAADARAGLTADVPYLPSKYHYDAAGSEIFEQITQLPGYYQTRVERAILEGVADDIVAHLEPRALIEFGSGSAMKTRSLLDAMHARGLLIAYGAIEVSETALRHAAEELSTRYPRLEIEGVVADFQSDVELPFPGLCRLVLFFGSTIGNLRPAEAVTFLSAVRSRMAAADGFLIGFDLVKDRARLEAAYNDDTGITERFSRNVLCVLNRELDGDIPIEAFRHVAIYDEDRARIEAYLVAQRRVRARLSAIDLDLAYEPGDRIRAELSYKYTRETVEALLARSGLRLDRWETDPEKLFAVALAHRG